MRLDVAAAGASSRASITSEVPFASEMRMKAPPPMPEEKGWTTPWQSATVTAGGWAAAGVSLTISLATTAGAYLPRQ